MAMTARRAGQEANTQDNQLKKAVRRANTRVHRVCDAVYEIFIGSYVQGLKEVLN